MRLALVCFYCLCVFVYVFYFIATMSFAGYFLSVLFCLFSMLISDSRFDLVWFRLSCDHGWIRSGSVNVRKTTTTTTKIWLLIFDTMSTCQTNAGKIILTSSKLHIRTIRHTLSEIRTKGDLVIKVSQLNEITKVKNRW